MKLIERIARFRARELAERAAARAAAPKKRQSMVAAAIPVMRAAEDAGMLGA